MVVPMVLVGRKKPDLNGDESAQRRKQPMDVWCMDLRCVYPCDTTDPPSLFFPIDIDSDKALASPRFPARFNSL
jgi:hypothetical protein